MSGLTDADHMALRSVFAGRSTMPNDLTRIVEAIVRGAVNEALTEAADEVERVADEAMSSTSRSFHPAGTHADGRRDGCWEGRMDAARIVRSRIT